MIETLFYGTAIITLISTVAALTHTNAAHALIYLVLSLLAMAVIFFLLGAPFAAALQVLIYAGAIMVLFVFVVMMLNLGEAGETVERQGLNLGVWIAPLALASLLLAQLLFAMRLGAPATGGVSVSPKEVGLSLYGPYVLAVEITSMLLLSALVGAYHVARTFLNRDHQGVR